MHELYIVNKLIHMSTLDLVALLFSQNLKISHQIFGPVIITMYEAY